jgi:diguanylate cyclase (GGDEF)-like protein
MPFTDARPERSKTRRFMPLFATALLGALVAAGAWYAAFNWEERLAKAGFTTIAGDYVSVLQTGLDRYVGKLLAVRAFYDASERVEEDEFMLFTGRLLHGSSSKMRISWGPLVTNDERAAFERQAEAVGLENNEIKAWTVAAPAPRAPDATDYFPVLFQSEGASLGSTIGFDLGSDPARRAVINRARDMDAMASTANVTLRAPPPNEHGFFVALPIYRRGLPHDTVETRRESLLGLLAASFKTHAVLQEIIDAASLPNSVDLFVFPSMQTADTTPIYQHAVSQPGRDLSPKSIGELEAGPHLSAAVKVADREWRVVVTPPGGKFSGLYRAWFVLAAVLAAFAALLTYMWISIRHALRLEAANRQISKLADTDLLTDLANRRAFLRKLGVAFATAREGRLPPFAVLYLDIDEFKDVNDTLGHPTGDRLITGVVERLRQSVRDRDFVARFGGDEFAILQFNVKSPDDAAALARKIQALFAAPFSIDSHEVHISSSIGISLYSSEVTSPEEMMVQADLALYRAKSEGRSRFKFHSPELDHEVHERVRISDELRAAIDADELELHYQPQVDLGTGQIIGLEALVRWNHKTRGQLGPASFIAVAEQTGTVLPLGQWVVEESCRQLKIWRDQAIAPPVLAVNISGVQFKGASEFRRDLEQSLQRWDIEPGCIELELTESVLMDATQKYGDMLNSIRRLGMKIAIDDFGTGYSSLKYLTVFPVSRLKLAQEFVFRVTADYRNAAVVRATIRLANELGIEVIAEGVETEAQMEFLMAAGCRQAQGYYFSRPVPAEIVTRMLREGRTFAAHRTQRPEAWSAA